METTGQLHAPAALPPGVRLPVLVSLEAWKLGGRDGEERNHVPSGIKLRSSSL